MASPSLNNPSNLPGLHARYRFTFPFKFPSSCDVPKCGSVLHSFNQLADHEAEHAKTQKNKKPCYVCHKAFSSAQALRIHLNTQHIKAGIHQCTCGEKYADPSRKSRCLKSHTVIFRCPGRGCSYRNSRKESVLRHVSRHKRGTSTTPIQEPCIAPDPPMHLPGRQPALLRPRTQEVLDKLADMENMCKSYSYNRLAALAKHFLSVGRNDLAEVTKERAEAIRDDQESSHRTASGCTTSEYSNASTSHGSDPITCDASDNQYHLAGLSYFPINHESPYEHNTLSMTFFRGTSSQTANTTFPIDTAHEGSWKYGVDNSLRPISQQSMASQELDTILAQLQEYSNRSSLDVTSDVQIDVTTDAYPSLGEGAGMATFYGNSNAPGGTLETQGGMVSGQGTARDVYFPEEYRRA